MRVILTGGGTGGHIYPAMAIGDTIRANNPKAEILYIGNSQGLETDIVPKFGYEMKFVDSLNLGGGIAGMIKAAYVNFKGIGQCKRIMKEFKPDIVIGTGGFVCFPVMYAAHKYGAKTYLHEQNAYPGKANRALEKYVNKLFLGFAEAGPYFRYPEKHVYTGNPVREQFFKIDKKVAREKLSIDDEQFFILGFGGSWGAHALNENIIQVAKKYSGNSNVRLSFATGAIYEEYIKETLEEEGVKLGDNIEILPYIDDMPTYLAAADLVVSRAGALSIAEASVLGKPSILVPFPNATGNHQFFNAKAIADGGGAILIEEKDLIGDALYENIEALRLDRQKLEAMGVNNRKYGSDNATEIIWRELLK